MELVEFLLARIAEDEAMSQAAVRWSEGASQWSDAGEPDWQHIARWDPARVLVECDAKRRIVELHPEHGWSHCEGESLPCPTLRLLALPYAEHPDYREEWKP